MAQSAQALKDIAQTLEQTIEDVTAREAAWAGRVEAPSRAAHHLQRLREIAAQRGGQRTRTEAVTQQAAVTDEEIRACEEELRALAGRVETLRQKLADWTGRAIG